jgi:hypothetical protein
MDWGKVGIGVAGAFGGVIAVLADLIQKQDASAVLIFAATLNRTFQLEIATWGWAFVLIILAIALCVVFEPDTKPRAFYIGASILTLLMTAVPFKIPDSAPRPSAANVGPLLSEAPFQLAAYVAAEEQSSRPSTSSIVKVNIQIRLPKEARAKVPFPIYFTFYDKQTDAKWRVDNYVTVQSQITGLYTTELQYQVESAPESLQVRIEASPLQTVELEAKKGFDKPYVVYRFDAAPQYSTASGWQKILLSVPKF